MDTPLISNLDMCENIALIKEVHENMSIVNASSLAVEMLSSIELEEIANRYVNSCSKEEIFLVMFLRAMMSQEKKIIISLPSNILGNLLGIKKLVQNMIKVNSSKKIIILDLINDELYYKGCECNIEKLN